jgi:hypothetical protein
VLPPTPKSRFRQAAASAAKLAAATMLPLPALLLPLLPRCHRCGPRHAAAATAKLPPLLPPTTALLPPPPARCRHHCRHRAAALPTSAVLLLLPARCHY